MAHMSIDELRAAVQRAQSQRHAYAHEKARLLTASASVASVRERTQAELGSSETAKVKDRDRSAHTNLHSQCLPPIQSLPICPGLPRHCLLQSLIFATLSLAPAQYVRRLEDERAHSAAQMRSEHKRYEDLRVAHAAQSRVLAKMQTQGGKGGGGGVLTASHGRPMTALS